MWARLALGAVISHCVAVMASLSARSRRIAVRSGRAGLAVVLLAGAAAVFEMWLLAHAWRQGNFGIDFEQTLLPAAKTVAAGNSPYPAYGYPPLVAFALVPLTVLPGPQVVFAVLLAACVPASLWFLGVRDLRCYAVAFLWAPVFSAIQTENVTLALLLGIAVCWHARDRWRGAGIAAGLAIAAKILCWPITVWLLASRRLKAGATSIVSAVVVTLGLWGALGFSGLLHYPSSLRGLGELVAPESYTLKALLVDMGAGVTVGKAAGTVLALAVVAGVVALARRGDDRRSFGLAAVAMIVASPIVWLHSFALLLAPVAVLRPRLGAAWLVPIAMVVTSGTGNGHPWQTAVALGACLLTVALALVPADRFRLRWGQRTAGLLSTTTSRLL